MNKSIPIKKRLTMFIITIIIIFSCISILLYSITIYDNYSYDNLMNNYFIYNNITSEINQASVQFTNYMQNNSSQTLDDYNTSVKNALGYIQNLKISAPNEDIYYALINIENLIDSYSKKNQEIINILSVNPYNNFNPQFTESQSLYNYINIRLSNAMESQISDSRIKFENINQTAQTFGIITIIMLVGVFSMSLYLSIRFSKKISSPITSLTDFAENLSRGKFDIEDFSFTDTSEIKTLTNSLNKMKKDIKSMFEGVKDKAALEMQLHEKELENLKITNELKNIEIKMLQSQINPHFLFNTLNSIGRLAYLNGNDDIITMIESLSEMLRYNLNRIDRPVTLEDEIKNLERYIYIQKMRFKDKLNIVLDITTKRLNIPIPTLTLQPLVENSIIHGLKSYDYCGDIFIRSYDSENYVIVEIEDTGIGIDSESIESLLESNSEYENTTSTGIGIQNVLTRIKAFYDGYDVFSITSIVGKGTVVKLKLRLDGDVINV